MGGTKNLPNKFSKKHYFYLLTSSTAKSNYFEVSPGLDKNLQGGLRL